MGSPRWEREYAEAGSDRERELLAEGWEPFAVHTEYREERTDYGHVVSREWGVVIHYRREVVDGE